MTDNRGRRMAYLGSAAIALALVLSLPRCTAQEWKSQLVGLSPTEGTSTDRALEWLRVRWPKNSRSADTVEIDYVDLDDPIIGEALGALTKEYVQFTTGSPQLTCRMTATRDRLLCLERLDPLSKIGASCCADSIMVYFKDGRPKQPVRIDQLIRDALLEGGDLSPAEALTCGPSHTINLDSKNFAELVVLVLFEYNADALGGARDYGVVRLDLSQTDDGSIARVTVVPTASGRMGFVGFRDVGTLSTDPVDSLYKVQYAVGEDFQIMNDCRRVRDPQTGVPLMVYSHAIHAEVMVLSDPWSMAEVVVLQRFGTPPILDGSTGAVIAYRSFGVSRVEGNFRNFVHGAWYSYWINERKGTITFIANNVGSVARVYEFVLSLRPRRGRNLEGLEDEDAFPTEYKAVDIDMSIGFGGAARPLEPGLYLVSSGKDSVPGFSGLKVVDIDGKIVQRSISPNNTYLDGCYDPFVFIDLLP